VVDHCKSHDLVCGLIAAIVLIRDQIRFWHQHDRLLAQDRQSKLKNIADTQSARRPLNQLAGRIHLRSRQTAVKIGSIPFLQQNCRSQIRNTSSLRPTVNRLIDDSVDS